MLQNFTFQEASPLITYSAGGWQEGSKTLDHSGVKYNGSFVVAGDAGASASFTFLGTAVSLFGATRANHGNYTVNLDQQPQFLASGGSSPDAFNKSLWHADNLAYTQHTVTITNVPADSNHNFLDLDFVSIERQLGAPGDDIFQLTLDDTSPSVNYTGSWSNSSDVSPAYRGTLHSTIAANAQLHLTFQGCCIEVYGQYANAAYTVALDNQPPVNMQGLDADLTADDQHPQTLLYLVDGLSEDSDHTVTLTNSNSNVNRPFSFDYAVISSTHELNSTGTTSGASSANNMNSSHQSSSSGVIAGGVFAGLAFLMLLGITALLLKRRRWRQLSERKHLVDLIDEEEAAEAKPYILPTGEGESHAYGQDPFEGGTHPPLPPGLDYSGHQGKSEAAASLYASTRSGRAGSVATSMTSGARSVMSSSSSRPASDMKRPLSLSQYGAGGESSQAVAVQEEDAGMVAEPHEAPALRTLPPAYNPDWHHD